MRMPTGALIDCVVPVHRARPMIGTEGAQVPVVSPNGQWVVFWADGAIRRIPLAGGPGFRERVLAASLASLPDSCAVQTPLRW
jgi:hypothetical protein